MRRTLTEEEKSDVRTHGSCIGFSMALVVRDYTPLDTQERQGTISAAPQKRFIRFVELISDHCSIADTHSRYHSNHTTTTYAVRVFALLIDNLTSPPDAVVSLST
jgi:hypothetical protein